MEELGGVRVSGNHQGGVNNVSLIQSTDLLFSCAVLAVWEKSSTKGNGLINTFVLRRSFSDPVPPALTLMLAYLISSYMSLGFLSWCL